MSEEKGHTELQVRRQNTDGAGGLEYLVALPYLVAGWDGHQPELEEAAKLEVVEGLREVLKRDLVGELKEKLGLD